MKRLIFSTIFAVLSLTAIAQYLGDKSFRPAFYVGTSAGINSYWGEGYEAYMLEHAQNSLGFIGRITLGYDFTSVIGLRGSFGYAQHNWPNANNNFIAETFEARTFTGDLTVNITNWIGGYDYTQKYNLIAFGGAGAGNQYTLKLWSYILRGGLQGNFILSKYIDLNVAGEINIVQDKYNDLNEAVSPLDCYPAITVGLTYHIKPEKHKMYKKRTGNLRSSQW